MSGTTGRLPAATTIRSAVISSAPDLDPPRPDEVAPPAEHGDVLALLPVAPAARGVGVDPAEDPVPDVGPADAGQLQVDAQRGRLLRRPGQTGRVDVHLARDATDVEAGAAEGARLDDRHRLVGEPVVDDRVAGAGTDDAEIEVAHGPMVPALAASNAGHRTISRVSAAGPGGEAEPPPAAPGRLPGPAAPLQPVRAAGLVAPGRGAGDHRRAVDPEQPQPAGRRAVPGRRPWAPSCCGSTCGTPGGRPSPGSG